MPDTQLENVTIHYGEVGGGPMTYNPDRISFISYQPKVLPLLRELGTIGEDIRAITVDAPLRYFRSE